MASVKIARAVTEQAKKLIKVEWETGHQSVYPMAWLRDNCRCPKCFHPVVMARLNLMKDLKPETLTNTDITVEESNLRIQWNDGHLSPFTADWLHERDYSNIISRLEAMAPEKKVWDTKKLHEMGGIPRIDYEAAVKDDASLLAWIEHLRTVGLVILENCPQVEGPCDEIAKRIGFYKTTHYGDHWAIRVRSDPNNPAYTGAPIGLHTDLSYYSNPPGVGLFHCIQQFPGDGGASEFCDGHHVLDVLKAEDSDAYDILNKMPLSFFDIGGEHNAEETGLDTTFLKRRVAPTIERDWNGNIFRINYNNQGRDSFLPVEPEKVHGLYTALNQFNEICYRPENVTIFKLQPGEMIAFDNYRMFHGRTGFEMQGGASSERHFHGGYLDWDEVNSRFNRLTVDQFQKTW